MQTCLMVLFPISLYTVIKVFLSYHLPHSVAYLEKEGRKSKEGNAIRECSKVINFLRNKALEEMFVHKARGEIKPLSLSSLIPSFISSGIKRETS